jgi:hypothetical protein
MVTLTIVLAVLILMASCVILLVRKLAGPETVAQCDAEWVNSFSVNKYRPMLRLLDGPDYKFLATQRGISKKAIRKLRAERRAIFREYMRNLVSDFNHLHLAARMLLIYSHQDRPDLAASLLRQRVRFGLTVASVECRLLMHAAGVGTVNVSALVESIEAMRTSISFSMAPQAI